MAARPGAGGRQPRELGSAGTLTAYAWSAVSGTTSRARSWVAASTTGAATPSSYACRHRAATTHQRSPGCCLSVPGSPRPSPRAWRGPATRGRGGGPLPPAPRVRVRRLGLCSRPRWLFSPERCSSVSHASSLSAGTVVASDGANAKTTAIRTPGTRWTGVRVAAASGPACDLTTRRARSTRLSLARALLPACHTRAGRVLVNPCSSSCLSTRKTCSLNEPTSQG